ncbi:MAG: quinol:cytochrome C oxidoreductase [Candidatus Marinimicrobia bacterium]|nr:quinol:cytochrome C oxidoreductase [Candidatus Neomarinimicrobiota bacterium]MDP6992486.1 quinol:cytochrome C oxidoreductase [Candidatus Neomarinimicrobiota bacterium]
MNNRFKINQSLFNWISGATAVGVLTLILGVLFSERIWPNVLLAAWYITGIGFSGIMFVAIHYVSNAGWGVAIRRIPEAMFAALPIGFLLMILVVLGAHHIYEWTHLDVVAKDPILQGKQPWLNLTGFIIRIPIYFGLWFLFGKPILNHSRKQDEDGDASHSVKSMRWSAAFLYLGGIAFVIASFDWIMSVEPHWFSTIFGFYNFAGMFDAGLAFMIIVLIYLRRGGYLPELKNDHLHELGRYLFAFTTFWVYIWFSQHMLIWYANLPEETGYYLKRHFGSFGVLAVLNICLNWLIPFMILMFRKTKRSEKSLLLASFIVLAGHWTDLYMMIFPPLLDTDVPVFGLMEIGVVIGMIGVTMWVVLNKISKGNMIPVKDPYLEESLNLHT